MQVFTVRLSDEEVKALLSEMDSVQTWLENLTHDRARKAMERVIAQETNLNPKKLSSLQKEETIRPLKVKTAREKTLEGLEEEVHSG